MTPLVLISDYYVKANLRHINLQVTLAPIILYYVKYPRESFLSFRIQYSGHQTFVLPKINNPV